MTRVAASRRRMTGLLLVGALTAAALVAVASTSGAATEPSDAATPGVACDAGSFPETTQGRANPADGRATTGYSCNARMVSRTGTTGGFRTERYVDLSGHECAYFDTTLLFPKDAAQLAANKESTGTWVMDMSDPAKPVHTDTLLTPAFESPHESVRLNKKRGLIVADMGYPTYNPGFVDVYDVSADCRKPVLKSSTPLGILGHESGFAPDGNTFYVSSLYGHTLAAVDLRNPTIPTILWQSTEYQPHGMGVSDDGTRLYMTEGVGTGTTGNKGLTILDVSDIQNRVLNPQPKFVSRLSWPHIGTPQNALPFTRGGRHYVAEIDEYGSGDNVGAARIIDIENDKAPFVVSLMRLAVNQKDAQAGAQSTDPGASLAFQGYKGHNCELPTRVDPTIIACSFIVSGLRVFNIEDVSSPIEVAYFNAPLLPANTVTPPSQAYGGNYAMSAPSFVPERNEIWYSDGNRGFYVVRLTDAATRSGASSPSSASPTAVSPPSATPTATVTPTATSAPAETATPTSAPAETATPTATSSASADGTPNPSSSPASTASASATSSSPPASEPPPSSPPDPAANPGGRAPLTLTTNTDLVQRGYSAMLSVTGQPFALADLRCYSRPSTTYVTARSGVRLPESGRLLLPIRPGTNTRCYARYVEEESSASGSIVVNVRAALSLSMLRTATRTYTFQGRSLTEVAGQRVTVYRIVNGRSVRTAVATTDDTGTWSLSRTFTGVGRYSFFARTDNTSLNRLGASRLVTTTLR